MEVLVTQSAQFLLIFGEFILGRSNNWIFGA